jgi:site-specific recombinase XerD
MQDSPVSVPDATTRFFDNYLNCLMNAAIPEKQRRWYVKRVEEFIKAQNGQKIKRLTGTDVNRYFEVIGRKSHLTGWQYQQCISAIRILYCDLLQTQVCQDVNWDYWIDSAKQLELDHPATAKELILSIGLDPVY